MDDAARGVEFSSGYSTIWKKVQRIEGAVRCGERCGVLLITHTRHDMARLGERSDHDGGPDHLGLGRL